MRYITAVVLFTIGATVQGLPVPDSQDEVGLRLRFCSYADLESGLTDALRLKLFAKPAINVNVGGKSNGLQIAIRYLSPGTMVTNRKWF
jgi:predicted component of type VI protein secretion system